MGTSLPDQSPLHVLRGVKVLLVDDNLKLLTLFTEALHEIGECQVMTATNGIEALDRYFEFQPDCLVIDVKMPGLDGYQLVRALRGDPETTGTPLILLTAMAQEKDVYTGVASGADQYLTKPTTPIELLHAIRRVMAITESERTAHLRAISDDASKP
jgi:CheY-like chemotaxis protein